MSPAERAKELRDELSALSKLQSETLETARYVIMSRDEALGYDRRRTRMTEIQELLKAAGEEFTLGFR